jgi:hypothetical protein
MRSEPSDDDLLTSDDPEAFGVFYARPHAGDHGYFARRVGSDGAGDLTAETFASVRGLEVHRLAVICMRRVRSCGDGDDEQPGDDDCGRDSPRGVASCLLDADHRLLSFRPVGLLEFRSSVGIGALEPVRGGERRVTNAPDLV